MKKYVKYWFEKKNVATPFKSEGGKQEMATALKTFPVFEVMFNSLVKGVISNDYERVSENCTESINKLNQYMKITFFSFIGNSSL